MSLSNSTIGRTTRTGKVDGRRLRSVRTRAALVEAFLELLQNNQALPTAVQIAQEAGCSTRSFFERFADFNELYESAFDFVLQQGLSTPVGDIPTRDRKTRIDFQVRVRAENCEKWLPLWRAVTRAPSHILVFLQPRISIVRQMTLARIELMYQPELSSLSDKQRKATLIALEALTDYEAWGRMREQHQQSFEAACDVWKAMIDRILPPNPDEGRQTESVTEQAKE